MQPPDYYEGPPRSSIKDDVVVAAASLLGCLYGVAAATMLTAAVAALCVTICVAGAINVAKKSASLLVDNKAPLSAAGYLVTGTASTAVLASVAAAATAFFALVALVVAIPAGAISSATYAKNNQRENFLSRIFSGYIAVSARTDDFKAQLKEKYNPQLD